MAYRVQHSQTETLFSPSDIPGLALWLDSIDPAATGVLPANGTITTWKDKSGNGNDFTTLAGTVTFNGTGANRGLSFASSTMSRSSFTDLVVGAAGTDFSQTIVICCTLGDFATENGLFSYGTNSPAGSHVFFSAQNNSSTPSVFCAGLGLTRFANTTATFSTTAPMVLAMVVSSRIPSGVAHNVLNFANGYGNTGSVTIGASPTISLSTSTVYLGARYDNTLRFTGRMYEVLYYDGALPTPQLYALQAYLRGKYTAWDQTVFSNFVTNSFDRYPRLIANAPMKPFHPIEISSGFDQFGLFSSNMSTSLRLWLDGSDPRTITTSAGKITSWRDKSGSGNALTPVGIYGNAAVQSSYQNGLDVVNFTGNNFYRSTVNGTAPYPHDCFLVVALKSLVRTDVIGIGSTTNDQFNSLTFFEYTGAGQRRWHNGSSNFNRTTVAISSTSEESSTGFLVMNWICWNNNFLIRRNGVQLCRDTTLTMVQGGTPAFTIAARQPFSSAPDIACNMFLAEVLVFDRILVRPARRHVEQYLATKWGLLSSFSWPTPRYRNLIPEFNPRSIVTNTNQRLTIWVDAADVSTLTLSTSGANTVVEFWTDKSGYRINSGVPISFSQSGAGRPFYKESTLRAGIAEISFNGVDQWMNLVDLSENNDFFDTTSKTVFCVVNNLQGSSATAGSSLIFGSNQVTGLGIAYTSQWGLWCNSTTTLGHLNTTTGGSASATQSFTKSTIPTLLTATHTSVNFSVGQNGATRTEQTSQTGATTMPTAFIMSLGRGTSYCSFSIHELLLFRGQLTVSQIQVVEGYLAWKWKIQHLLPTTHAYYQYVSG
jgi:hypothetical protein